MASGSPLRAQTVAVMVNGEPITNYDIEQRGKLNALTTHKPPVRQDVINELIDEKVKIREGKKFGVDPDLRRCRPVLRRDELADAHHARSAHQNARKPGHPAGHAEGAHEGRDGLDQPGSRPLQGKPAGRREGRRRRRPGERRRETRDRSLRISAAAGRADRAARIAAGRRSRHRRKEAEALRSACRPARRPTPVQVDAKCRDPRRRDQDLGRHPGRCSAKCSTRPRSVI